MKNQSEIGTSAAAAPADGPEHEPDGHGDTSSTHDVLEASE